MSSRAQRKGVAYLARSDDPGARIPFVCDGVVYSVALSAVRHLEADCPAILGLRASALVWTERVVNDAELGAKTARCTGGCWSSWEAAEQRAITKSDERKRVDWEEDGVQGRQQLARWVREGFVAGEVVGPVAPE